MTEMLEREFVSRKLLLQIQGFFLIDLGLYLLDELEHIAHSQNALGNPVGIERFYRVVPLTHADELNWLTGHFLYRERRPSARIALHLSQHNAGEPDPIVEFLRGSNSVLTGHRIGDEQNLCRLSLALNLLKL